MQGICETQRSEMASTAEAERQRGDVPRHGNSAQGLYRRALAVIVIGTRSTNSIVFKTSISFTVLMQEQDPLFFQDPKCFNPERWLGDTEEARKARLNSITFGTGSRVCLGQL